MNKIKQIISLLKSQTIFKVYFIFMILASSVIAGISISEKDLTPFIAWISLFAVTLGVIIFVTFRKIGK